MIHTDINDKNKTGVPESAGGLKKIDSAGLRKIQLDILQSVSDFCMKNNLTYFLCYGTLIGAVRHKGYIPWDDDIDIAMPRPDYEKFLHLFNGSYPHLRAISYELDRNFPYTYAKVEHNGTLLVEYSSLKYNLGINIDIFPIDGVPTDKKKLRRLLGRIRFCRALLEIKSVKISRSRALHKNLILLAGKVALAAIPARTIIGKILRLSRSHPYAGATHAAILVWGYGPREVTRKENFSWTIFDMFEGREFCIPGGYHDWLTGLYGNYMEPPPHEKRTSHHVFTAYLK